MYFHIYTYIASYTRFVDSIITTSTSFNGLKVTLGLSDEKTKKVTELALQFQLSSDVDKFGKMPSETTMINIGPKGHNFQKLETTNS